MALVERFCCELDVVFSEPFSENFLIFGTAISRTFLYEFFLRKKKKIFNLFD